MKIFWLATTQTRSFLDITGWSVCYKCRWLFDQSILVINGVNCQLTQRPSRSTVRRIYVRETVVVANDMQVNVPLHMPLASLCTPKSDWSTQACETKPGLYAARTLLSNDDHYAAVRFVKMSGSRQVLKRVYVWETRHQA